MKLLDIITEFIDNYGINIYRWEKVCWKCGKKTKVYSYFLNYDLGDSDDILNFHYGAIGLGDIEYVDRILQKEISTIDLCYSNTTRSQYVANKCEHCGALQGHNYVVDDPHEIIGELWHNRDMEKYLYRKIFVEDSSQLLPSLKSIFADR
jgi:hypothetical protein